MKDIDKIQYKDYFTSKEMSNYIFGDKENNNSSKIYYYIMQLTNEGKIDAFVKGKMAHFLKSSNWKMAHYM